MATAENDNIVQKIEDMCQEMHYGEWEQVDSLLRDAFPDNIKLPNVHIPARQTILHVAAMSAAPEPILVRLLEMVDADFCSQPDKFGDTPLYLISTNGKDSATIRLLSLQRPQDFLRTNASGESPCDKLMSRIDSDDGHELYESDVTEIIVAVTQVNPRVLSSVSRNGESILHRAIPYSFPYQDFVLIRTLLSLQAELIQTIDVGGATPVHRAAREDDSDAGERVQILIENGGSHALCLQDIDGRTPLHTACHWGSTIKVIETLVMNDSNSLQVRDQDDMTPLDTFRQFHHSLLTETDYTGDNWNDDAYVPIVDSCMTLMTGTPLRCSDEQSPSLHDLLRNQECTLDIAKLLIYGLRHQTSVQDSNGNLPLHVVAMIESDDTVMYDKVLELLLELYPLACQVANHETSLPLELMLRSGKTWDTGMKRVLLEHPAAVLDLGLNPYTMCSLMSKLGKEENAYALFRLLRDAPQLLQR